MTSRERIMAALRHRGSASYKEIALGVEHRDDRDAIVATLRDLVASGEIEIASIRQVTVWDRGIPVAGTRTRYRLAGGRS